MAERRMFAKTIVLSDAFLDMPLSARCLYFTLGMLADDDGFVGNPKGIMRQCGSSIDDLKVLLSKRFLIGFDSGVIVIKHWRMNNYLQKDRYKETSYLEEKGKLLIKDNGAYTEIDKPMYTECIQTVYTGKDSIGKYSLGNNSGAENTTARTTKKPFLKPSLDEVQHYFVERGSTVSEAEHFYDHYESNGWCIGRQAKKMSDWKAAARNWLRNDFAPKPQTKMPDFTSPYKSVLEHEEKPMNKELEQYLRELDEEC